MTEFKIVSTKQVIIHELVQEDLDNFMHYCVVNDHHSAYWNNGMIIDIARYPWTDFTIVKTFSDIELYMKLIFVKYPKYSRKINWSEGVYELNLLDKSNSSKFTDITKWIKTQPIWNQNVLEIQLVEQK